MCLFVITGEYYAIGHFLEKALVDETSLMNWMKSLLVSLSDFASFQSNMASVVKSLNHGDSQLGSKW